MEIPRKSDCADASKANR